MDYPECIIRLMRDYDVPSILEIEQDLFSDPWGKDIFIAESRKGHSYVLELQDDHAPTAGGTSNCQSIPEFKVIGFLCGTRRPPRYKIDNMAIAGEFQNKGLGKFLLSRIIIEEIKQRCIYFSLEVRESNKKAIRLYKALGFKEVAVNREYYRKPDEDALIMEAKYSFWSPWIYEDL